MKRRFAARTLVLSAILAAMGGLPARPASAFHQATVHVEDGGDEAKVDLSGPYASVTIAFGDALPGGSGPTRPGYLDTRRGPSWPLGDRRPRR
jgi:hypothetical protein